MSAVSRGKAFENFVADQLKQMGYHIAYKSVRMRFGAIDFDGLWDIVAIKRVEFDVLNRGLFLDKKPVPPMVTWMFVQCKSTRMYGQEKQKLIDWMHKYGFAGINCMIAVKIKDGRKTAIEWHTLA
jgi:hypothetical protein